MKEIIIIASIILFLIAVLVGSFSFRFEFEKDGCYEKASFYKVEVKSFSFWKKYCFVEMEGRNVNLNSYRDFKELK